MAMISPFLQRITNHYENMRIANQRILAQFKAQIRRYDFKDNYDSRDKYQSTTCMETINERSKEAEEEYNCRPIHRGIDQQLEMILEPAPEDNYITKVQKYDPSALQQKFRKSPGWTISAQRQSSHPSERKQPQIRQFSHINDNQQ